MKKLSLIKEKINKIKVSLLMSLVTITTMSNLAYADVVSEVNGGGSIQSSKLGQGIMNMIEDLTGTLQWILPVVGVLVILWYVFKIMTGDEQDQARYKKAAVRVGICIIAGLAAVTIVNLIAKYFT